MADESKSTDRLEVISVVILSLAALASAWATYQAGLWDGAQAAHYSRTNALRIQASQAALEGDALATVEVQVFGAWLTAKVHGDAALATFYERRLPPSFRPAFNAWIEQQPVTNAAAAPSPFAMPGYRRPGRDASLRFDRQADKIYAEGQYANAVSDAFSQSATILALSMFFGGIGQVYRRRFTRTVLLVMAGLTLVMGLLRMTSLPVQFLGLHAPG